MGMSTWLDGLPAYVRHAIILCVIAPATSFVLMPIGAVISSGGVFGIGWATVFADAANAAGVSFASGATTMIALWVTPLTRQYGLGERDDVAP